MWWVRNNSNTLEEFYLGELLESKYFNGNDEELIKAVNEKINHRLKNNKIESKRNLD